MASPGRGASLATKRAFDIVAATLLLLATSPVLAILSLVITLTGQGPALFRQRRVGLDGRPFMIFKLRSMYSDCCDHSGVRQTVAGDGRVTPLGRRVRRFFVDELPQLINVIIGDMSLVGPRPHVPGMLAAGTAYEAFVPYYHHRHAMRPGMTGWAQANGYRGPTDDGIKAQARIDHDIAYVQNFTLLLDLKILLRTVPVVLRGSGV